jgi:hypothetical protein
MADLILMAIGLALGIAIVRYAQSRMATRGDWFAPWDY